MMVLINVWPIFLSFVVVESFHVRHYRTDSWFDQRGDSFQNSYHESKSIMDQSKFDDPNLNLDKAQYKSPYNVPTKRQNLKPNNSFDTDSKENLKSNKISENNINSSLNKAMAINKNTTILSVTLTSTESSAPIDLDSDIQSVGWQIRIFSFLKNFKYNQTLSSFNYTMAKLFMNLIDHEKEDNWSKNYIWISFALAVFFITFLFFFIICFQTPGLSDIFQNSKKSKKSFKR